MSAPTLPRSSGLLLHPTSLPGPFGVGDLGPAAYRWVDRLAAASQAWWQILPLNPPGAGDSPYTAISAFAGNVVLLSPEQLAADGLVDPNAVPPAGGPADRVDYGRVVPYKNAVLRAAWDRFRGRGPGGLRDEFDHYCRAEAGWLDDFAVFAAVRDGLGGRGLADWPADLVRRDPVAVGAVASQYANEVAMHKFGQFLFDRQWRNLRTYANDRGVKLIGDAPIFVSADSADVWAHRDQFLFGPDGKPTAVAGVPPDYFSPTGQLWGNPLYDWNRMAATGYAWWAARMRRLLSQVDVVRLDHFRGFAAAWHVPPTEPTAANGRWVDGPRDALFTALSAALGPLPLVAEDLGLITPDVHELRRSFGLPGMRVLQFAVGGPDNPYWPHNYEPNTVAYTGTHDNDTTNGWYYKLDDGARWKLGEYFGKAFDRPAWELIRAAWGSVAVLAIAPLQDVLELGTDCRMNVPGVAAGNWAWRVRDDQLHDDPFARLRQFTELYHRVPARSG